ncbi:hypothetical protein GCM10010954_24000 [Halobacillus andaensis]|uniref:Uncharacterized protein n=1 Tax=Halobacillus andaensis TaxID=1176239 RepID=A0A917B6U1_HALAA|nr:hypothetical protein [Halobacillus andaensis]MBP2006011.1 hypothetical protein [Halobacillus andaensis]GGF24323.1 hypothetical protein GCM10010954_24000 [Halobacillus andaensis]
MRKLHCEALIEDLEEMIPEIKNKTDLHVQSSEPEVIIPRVKSFFEHNRSVLEYCANDVFELLVSKENRTKKLKSRYKNVYFPYGETKEIFERNFNNNLPGLSQQNHSIYKLISGLQDFNRRDDKKFLNYMCRVTNKNKHDQLSTQERRSEKTVNIGNFISSTNSNVTISGGTYNGLPMGDFKITTDGEIIGKINLQLLKETVIIENGFLIFKDSGKKVLPFLELCKEEVKSFYIELYKLLNDAVEKN